MKTSAILTRAAELVDSDNIQPYDAIWRHSAAGRADMLFWRMFGLGPSGSRKRHRVMALLLCAAIAESKGD